MEKHGDSGNDFYITLKTLSASKEARFRLEAPSADIYCEQEQVVVDFGGLEFEWMPIRANKAYEKWLEDNVIIRSHVGGLAVVSERE